MATASTTPVPSITLQVTQKDAERFLKASEELETTLNDLQRDDSHANNSDITSANPNDRDTESPRCSSQPLHERIYRAAQSCKHPFVASFLERMASSGIPLQEVKAGVMLFHDVDKTTKLRHLFQALGDRKEQAEPILNREGAVSLFRSVLIAISCCVHTPEQLQNNNNNVIVEGKPATGSPTGSPDRPVKRIKREEETASTKQATSEDSSTQEFRASQSPSFDSSLATLRDEDDTAISGNMRREIEEIVAYAADELLRYNAKNSEKKEFIDFATFGDWYNASGSAIVPWLELLQLSKWKRNPKSSHTEQVSKDNNAESPGSLATEDSSPALISFDFSGADRPTSLCISISEDNLHALRHLVHRTGLVQRPAAEVCKTLLQISNRKTVSGDSLLTLRRDGFRQAIGSLIPGKAMQQLSKKELEAFENSLLDFFAVYEGGNELLEEDEVDLKELAIGICFFCAGNKSTKLATGFELLDEKRRGYLTEEQLMSYLRSYLLALVALSFLMPLSKQDSRRVLSPQRKQAVRTAVQSGAKWTLGHFLNYVSSSPELSAGKNQYLFETFAGWYSTGGYNIAPWLELLDLNKVLSLIAESASPLPLPPFLQNTFMTTERKPIPRDRMSSLRRHHSTRRGPPPEILFSFPLANRRSLIVLKEDATYVRGVVEQLDLLSMNPDELWKSLSRTVSKRRKPKKDEVAVYVNSSTFVECMQAICPQIRRKCSSPGSSHATHSVEELLFNFYQCFDINQVDSVALDELMGGLTILCGGKKSMKLAFAFGIFDTRPGVHKKSKKSESIVHSLSGEDLFLFLRSILIVTFSCCRQSLDMDDADVGRCIADTANMICNDVMRHQWETKHTDRVNFDEFGQWYNDGGFERAPWLELLDLRKWVLVDDFESLEKQAPGGGMGAKSANIGGGPVIPPPPPEDALDPSFFDEGGIMPMDSIDEMDMILMQQPSTDKEIDEGTSPRILKSFSYSPGPRQQLSSAPLEETHPLKFHLNVANEEESGYQLSLSRIRIAHFRRILEESGLNGVSVEDCCNAILSSSSPSRSDAAKLTKEAFESAVGSLTSRGVRMSVPSQRALMDLLSEIFSAFDRDGKGRPSAIEVAAGLTVLCHGKKSDKLEYAFEVLDKGKRGRLSKKDMTKYIKSFLTVLLCIAFSASLENDPRDDTFATMSGGHCERSASVAAQTVKSAAEWAASQAFQGFEANSMTFDDFAAWYTTAGFNLVPWLELIDLNKWVA